MSDRVFTYGSLMCTDIMSAVCGYSVVGEAAQLSGYCRRCVRGEIYPGIAPHPQSEVSGMLYSGISAAALARLDAFEGEYYRRLTVASRDAAGRLRQAQCYVFKPQYYPLLTDEEWCFETFLETGKARFERLFGAEYGFIGD